MPPLKEESLSKLFFLMSTQSWFDTVHSGKFYHTKTHGYRLPPPSSRLPTQKLPATPAKRCPIDSPRNTGRQAHVFHAIELGPFYQILESFHPEKWWIRTSRLGKDSAYRTVIATTEKGERTYFGEWMSDAVGLATVCLLHRRSERSQQQSSVWMEKQRVSSKQFSPRKCWTKQYTYCSIFVANCRKNFHRFHNFGLTLKNFLQSLLYKLCSRASISFSQVWRKHQNHH